MLLNYNVSLHFVFENEQKLPEYLMDYLIKKKIESEKNNQKIDYYFENDLNKVISIVDVIYMTRSQKERHKEGEHLEVRNKLTVHNFANAKPKCIILHPLPRNDEIETNLDNDPRSVYFRQMKYGLYVRIALLEMLFS